MTIETEVPLPGPFAEVAPSREAPSTTIVVEGELDAMSAPALRAAIHELAEWDRPAFVVVDAAGLSFIDATGLGVLLTAERRLRRRGGGLRVVNVRPTVRRAFALTGLLWLAAPQEDASAQAAAESCA